MVWYLYDNNNNNDDNDNSNTRNINTDCPVTTIRYSPASRRGRDKRGFHRRPTFPLTNFHGKMLTNCGNICRHVTNCDNILQNVARCAHLKQTMATCTWPFCENPVCPDTVWKTVSYAMSCHSDDQISREIRMASGGTTCLTLLVQRRWSSKVANNVANDGDPWHYEQRIKHMRPY